MDAAKFIVLLTCLITAVATQDPEPRAKYVTVDVSQSLTHVGDNVTFTCRVTDLEDDDTVYIFKTVMQPNNVEQIETITIGSEFSPPYHKFPRYRVDKTETGPTTLYILNIYGVQTSDSGHIGCSVGVMGENLYDMEQFNVYQNAENVTFENFTSQGHITVQEDESVHLLCRISEVRPVPHIKIFKGDEEVTKDFMESQVVNVKKDDGVPRTKPLYYTYTVEMANKEFTASYEDRGKVVSCEAEVLGSNMKPVRHELTLDVLYSAHFECESEVSAVVGDPSVQISCNVTANPHPLNATYGWRFMQGDSEQYLPTGITRGMYSTGAERTSDEDVTVTLTIFNVLEDHFGDYTLVTCDLLENRTHVITLEQAFPDPEESGASSIGAAVPLVSLLAFVLACLSLRAH